VLTMELIAEAAAYLADRVRRTPLEPSPALAERLGVPVWLKLECLQLTGSFKIRGAAFRLSRLDAGNHGKAVAHAARDLGIPVRIYVPGSVDESKYQGMLRLGATVVRADVPGFDETEVWARAEAQRLGLPYVSAYEDDAVMAGNGGTLAKEIRDERPEVRSFVIPVSGGGLGAGLAFYVRTLDPGARVVACQHAGSPSLARSLERGEAATRMPPIDTLAGGIEGGIGRANFAILKDRVDEVQLLDEQALYEATVWVLREHQYLVEPSAAVTVAACLSGRLGPLGGPTVVVLSGRNLSVAGLRRVLAAT
jgi:threonine dehydratase